MLQVKRPPSTGVDSQTCWNSCHCLFQLPWVNPLLLCSSSESPFMQLLWNLGPTLLNTLHDDRLIDVKLFRAMANKEAHQATYYHLWSQRNQPVRRRVSPVSWTICEYCSQRGIPKMFWALVVWFLHVCRTSPIILIDCVHLEEFWFFFFNEGKYLPAMPQSC